MHFDIECFRCVSYFSRSDVEEAEEHYEWTTLQRDGCQIETFSSLDLRNGRTKVSESDLPKVCLELTRSVIGIQSMSIIQFTFALQKCEIWNQNASWQLEMNRLCDMYVCMYVICSVTGTL